MKQDSSTKKDLQKAVEHLASKDFVKEEIRGLEFRIDLKFDDLERKLEEQFQKQTSALFARMDPILSKFEGLDINRELQTQHTEDLQKKANNHEKRIVKLEKRVLTP